MQNKITSAYLSMIVCCLLLSIHANAQDKIYTSSGKVLDGKVTEVGPKQIRILLNVRADGPVYVYNTNQVDSIIYSNGVKDVMEGSTKKRNKLENIPQLNTWTFDVAGLGLRSISQSYERRLKNGKVGFRVPLYIGFLGGGIAGVGMFTPNNGVFFPETDGGFSIATGLNPKFYLFRRRIVRAFAGPEATVGFSRNRLPYYLYDNYGNYIQSNTNRTSSGTVAVLGKVGIMLNPVDKFNITIDGGAGVGDMFGSSQSQGLVGLWHIGISIGTNF